MRRRYLPGRNLPRQNPPPRPDPLAIYDDFAGAEALIGAAPAAVVAAALDVASRACPNGDAALIGAALPAPLSPWLRGFVASLARQTGDAALQPAARRAASGEGAGVLQGMLRQRMAAGGGVWR